MSKRITLEQLFADIPEADRLVIVKGAAKYFPPEDGGDDERAFPVDIDLDPTTS